MIRQALITIAFILALVPMVAGAQAERPRIRVVVQAMEPVPGGANNPLAPQAVTQAAGRIIAEQGYQWAPLDSERLPVGSTVIRVLYVVSERGASASSVVAASAATQLLQASNIGGGNLVLSLYNGVQQNISQVTNLGTARAQVHDLFVKELRERITNALNHLENVE
ncbi:MAG: hypothetical protein L0H83_00205 [Salinisphaera sp.]|nr:hypothetical protein [Salinisphaera sp.]